MNLAAAVAQAAPPPQPHKHPQSVGVVTAAGDPVMMANAWLMTKRLRAVGCELPVELFHLPCEPIPRSVQEVFLRQ